MTGRAQAILEEAAALPGAQRAPFLDQACAGDPALRAEVESLLSALDAAGHHGFLGSLNAGASPTGAAAGSTGELWGSLGEGPGSSIGPYRLVQVIGEGGFGRVFLAEQDAPVKRQVALKVTKLGMDTRRVIARFEAERQALAMMEHPNIARVFDAGATDTGRPYFVMELVRGIPITEYCDANNLTLRERLELFVPVCQAVQHAHQKGIIHRDLKPSNVLVTSTDGAAVPKVIDFGIAKATAARLTEKTVFTEHRQLIGTPEYMSPEQADASGLDIDTRSDIYSLGVLLYELLTGVLPFESARLRSAAFGEIQRIIREEEPRRPSTRLSTLEALPSVAALRRTEPARLTRLVRGDLDWIAMKCLEKDRTRRYETASGLAADIVRYLSGEPVIAAPPSAIYSARKFIRRNKVAVVATGLVAVALVLGMIGTTIGLLRAAHQREIVIKQRNSAAETLAKVAAELQRSVEGVRLASVTPGGGASAVQPESVDRLGAAALQLLDTLAQARSAETRQREKAELVSDFMSQTLRGAGPRVAVGRDATMLKEMLDSAAGRIEGGELKHAPEAELTLRATIGHTYRELGEYPAAESMLRPAVDRARLLAQESPSEHNSLLAACLDAWAMYLQDTGRLAEAEPLLEEALEISRRCFPAGSRPVAQAIMVLGGVRQALGLLPEAERLFREAVDVYRRALPGDHEEVAGSLHNLAFVLQEQGHMAQAEPLYRQALDMYDRLSLGDRVGRATTLNNLGMVLQAMGRLDEAGEQFRGSLEMRERIFKQDHAHVSQSLNNMAAFLHAAGRTAEAVPYQRRAVEMNRRLFSGDHPAIANGLSNLGVSLIETGRPGEAEPVLIEALEMARRLYPPDHPQIAHTTTALGNDLFILGRFEEAEPLFRQVVEIRERLFPHDHPDMALALSNLGAVEQESGKAVEADRTFAAAAAMAERLWPEGHAWRAAILARWAACLLVLNRTDEARKIADHGAAMAAALLPEGHPVRARIDAVAAQASQAGSGSSSRE